MIDRSVLKDNQMFLVTDPGGDIRSGNADGQGLYWRDTRFLSIFELLINGAQPQLLSASGEHNFMTNLQFANPRLVDSTGQVVGERLAFVAIASYTTGCTSGWAFSTTTPTR